MSAPEAVSGPEVLHNNKKEIDKWAIRMAANPDILRTFDEFKMIYVGDPYQLDAAHASWLERTYDDLGTVKYDRRVMQSYAPERGVLISVRESYQVPLTDKRRWFVATADLRSGQVQEWQVLYGRDTGAGDSLSTTLYLSHDARATFDDSPPRRTGNELQDAIVFYDFLDRRRDFYRMQPRVHLSSQGFAFGYSGAEMEPTQDISVLCRDLEKLDRQYGLHTISASPAAQVLRLAGLPPVELATSPA